MKIAIDFDKTIFDCNSRLYQIVNKFLPRKNSSLTYTPLSFLQRKDNLITKLYYKLFCFTHADQYIEYNNALRSINSLRQLGHEITILCSRPLYQISIMSLKDLAKMYNIDENNIIINCQNKINYCQRFNIDMIIDNDIDTCLEAVDNGIDAICFTNQLYSEVKTSHSWNSILKYISNIDQNEKYQQNC